MKPMRPMAKVEPWWPGDLGEPSSTGSQDAMDYAVFPEKHRLLVRRNGTTTAYDSGDHRIGGASQQQSGSASLAFTSQDGVVDLADLKQV